MQKAAPSLGRVAVMAGFALSCFGLLLFLWIAFGGSIPLKPKGYRFVASFSEATQLAQEADVRISGVPVGKVKTIEPDKKTGRSNVVIQLDSRYAPLPSDAKAILRQKTLLGETYVELTPGTKGAKKIPEGGRLRTSQVSPTVELDEIYRSFDKRTRDAFQVWMQTQAQAIKGHGRDINEALGNLGPFAEDASTAVDILNRQEGAVRRLISNTGVVFQALTERGDQLRGLIENSNTVFATTAARDRELQQAFVALPTFERESRSTLKRLDKFAANTDPLVTQLRPAARELSPTLEDLSALAPDAKALFRDLDKLITVSRTGFPAAQKIVRDLRPLLAQADPALRQVIPILSFLGEYKKELNSFFANTASATQAFDPGTRLHYLRTTNPLNAENLAAYPRRLGTNRPNPYQLPGGYSKLSNHLLVYENRHCGRALPTISNTPPAATSVPVPSVPGLPVPVPSVVPTAIPVPTAVPPEVSGITQSLIDRINQFAFPAVGAAPAPPCEKQGNFNEGGESTQYPHVKAK
jgi:phospholipid/cholesterol/gamma-HCH transport system substrate-binding protein